MEGVDHRVGHTVPGPLLPPTPASSVIWGEVSLLHAFATRYSSQIHRTSLKLNHLKQWAKIVQVIYRRLSVTEMQGRAHSHLVSGTLFHALLPLLEMSFHGYSVALSLSHSCLYFSIITWTVRPMCTHVPTQEILCTDVALSVCSHCFCCCCCCCFVQWTYT